MRATTERDRLLDKAESEIAIDTATRNLLQAFDNHPCTCAADPRRCKKANHAAAARRKRQ